MLGEGEPKAGALDVGLLGTETLERREEPGEVGSGDADTCVGDHEVDDVVNDHRDVDAHLAALAVVLDGVGHQVHDDLL